MVAPMTFEKLKVDTACKCLEDDSIQENIDDQFLRLIKGTRIGQNQFESLWEKMKRPKDLDDCKSVCMFK